METQREADRLRVYVNQTISLEASDLFALPPHGFYGVVWPDKAALTSLRGLRQTLSTAPGPLERGDELFAEGRFDEARGYFSAQVIELGGTPSGLEARFKEALALEHLQRSEDASQGYQSLAKEMQGKNANKWTVLASFQLWIHHLRNKKLDEADAVLENLLFQQSFKKKESLLLYIPDDLRAEILGKYRWDADGVGLMRFRPKRLHNTRRLVQLEELLEVPPIERLKSQLALVRVLRLEGQLEEAIHIVKDQLSKMPLNGNRFAVSLVAEYGWMMREKGTPSLALPEINRVLLEKPGAYRTNALALLIERARIHAAMNEWEQAKNDLDEFFRMPSPPQNASSNSADASLMLGMVREQCGDPAGAKEAWRKGRIKGSANDPNLRGASAVANALMLESLCQDVDEKRAESLFRGVLGSQAAMLNFLDAKNTFRSSAVVINRMWHTPKGKEIARRMVLQTCSLQQYIYAPVQVFAAEMIREEAIGAKTTPDQEELLWKLSEDVFAAFTSGKLTDVQAIQLAILWKRGPTFLGGIEIIKGFDPALRGPTAYFMGLRFQRLGRPAEAAFRMAAESAPANSTLERLTRIEREKESSKKSP